MLKSLKNGPIWVKMVENGQLLARKYREMEKMKDEWRLGAQEQAPVCVVAVCGAGLGVIRLLLGALRLFRYRGGSK